MVRPAEVAIVGFGNVGRTLAKLTVLKNEFIEKNYGIRLKVVAVIDSMGAAIKEEGFRPDELLRLTELPRSAVSNFKPYGFSGFGVKEAYGKILPDIHIEATPSNYVSGEPALSNVLFALNEGVNVVLCSKSPLALKFREVHSLAEAKRARIRFKATVMAGTPLIDLLMGLKGYDIGRIEGIINGSTNYILTLMHEELITFQEALTRAQALGIAEQIPDLDIKGWDAAAKLTIISNLLGTPLKITDVAREDLSKITLTDVIKALRKRYVIKYLAKLDLINKKASVTVEEVSHHDLLANVSGTLNAIKVISSINEIFLLGKGAGSVETAHAVLDDIITIAQEVRDPA